MSSLDIARNIGEITHRIEDACKRSGRNPNTVTLIGVSKTVDEGLMRQSQDCGIKIFGENKPQEIKRKSELFDSEVKWHMIGHLQSNKVKMIIDKVDLIHSVDRINVVDEIQKRAKSIDSICNILVQVNIGEESQKSGTATDALNDLIKYIKTQPNICVRGLMCIAPYLENAEDVRPYFKQMYQIFEKLKLEQTDLFKMEVLSMGMTHDFEVAIEEGATMIRVGTGIYGARHYT